MNQLILHLFGDYVLQSTWMALNKSKRSWPCLVHCFTYTVPFLIVTQSWKALLVIFGSHFLIDRFGLARYLVWLKEGQRPGGLFPWRWCSMTGYFDQEKVTQDIQSIKQVGQEEADYIANATVLFNDPNVNRPIWLRVWLLIIADNTLHLICNTLALTYL